MSRPNRAAPVTRRAPFAALALMSLLPFAAGCAALHDHPPRGAADGLQTAASEARKDDTEKKKVLATEPPTHETPPTVVEVEYASCDEPEQHVAAAPAGPHRRFLEGWDIGVVAGGAASGGSMLAPGADLGLRGGYAITPLTHADLSLIYGARRWGGASGFIGAFDSPYEITADLSVRRAITRDGRPIGLSPMLGVQLASVGWDYRHPVVADDGSGPRLVGDDLLDFYAPYAGLATRLIDSPRMRLDWVIKAGARFYDTSTWEGFANDSFRATGFVQVQLETHFPF
jgi:hypothetical protein